MRREHGLYKSPEREMWVAGAPAVWDRELVGGTAWQPVRAHVRISIHPVPALTCTIHVTLRLATSTVYLTDLTKQQE